MNPITREESLLDGQDLTPITRKEQFIKRIYDKTQETPDPITREEWFLKKAGEGTSPVTIEQLNATENGTYSEEGKAYSPVIVEVPAPTLITKTITENGTYNASEDNADGYSQVTVAVEGFKKKSITNTPTDIASFNDGTANPMPSLEISIEPVQSGSGDPSPSNVRPISGWSGVNIVDCGDSSEIEYFANLSKGVYGVVDLGSLSWSYQTSLVEGIEVFQATINGMTEGSTTFSCPFYENVRTRTNLITKDMTMARLNSSSSVVLIRNDNYTDAIAFKTAMSGVKLIYELSEPSAPTVTPSELQTIISSYNVTSQVTSISFEDSQGNPIEVYGGSVDVVNGGEQPSTYIKWTVAPTVNQIQSCSLNNCIVQIPTEKYPNSYDVGINKCLCDKLKPSNFSTQYDNHIHFPNTGSIAFFLEDEVGTTKDEWADYLAQMQINVCYKLATPTTFDTQPTAIKPLDRQNNIFADCGQVLQGEYFVTL